MTLFYEGVIYLYPAKSYLTASNNFLVAYAINLYMRSLLNHVFLNTYPSPLEHLTRNKIIIFPKCTQMFPTEKNVFFYLTDIKILVLTFITKKNITFVVN